MVELAAGIFLFFVGLTVLGFLSAAYKDVSRLFEKTDKKT